LARLNVDLLQQLVDLLILVLGSLNQGRIVETSEGGW
jgi:hypothetical protein